MRDFPYSWITEQLIVVRCSLWRDARNTETMLFTMFLAFVLYGHKADECNMTWPIAHEVHRCTFWTSCTGVSCKRPFLCILRNFWCSSLMDMQVLVGRVLHTGIESSLKMSYLGCFWFSFYQGHMVSKRRQYSALHVFHVHYTTRDWVVHILDWIMLDNDNFLSRKLCFLCIMYKFGHSSVKAAPLGVWSSVHRALDNTETVLFGVCFAFLIYIHSEVENCMT